MGSSLYGPRLSADSQGGAGTSYEVLRLGVVGKNQIAGGPYHTSALHRGLQYLAPAGQHPGRPALGTKCDATSNASMTSVFGRRAQRGDKNDFRA